MANGQPPRGREKNVTGQGKDVYRRGSGLGSGPVGTGSGRGSASGGSSGSQHTGGSSFGRKPTGPIRSSTRNAGGTGAPVTRAAGGKGGLLKIIIPVVLVIIFAKILFGGNSGGGTSVPSNPQGSTYSGNQSSYSAPSASGNQSAYSSLNAGGMAAQTTPSESDSKIDYPDSIMSLIYGYNGSGNVSSGWTSENNTGVLNTNVTSGARDKFTVLKGKGKDTVTVMLYMCGADLESKGGMATADLKEILNANIADNVNFIVYTGGCRQWKNTNFSAKTNQIYRLMPGGKLQQLKADAGNVSMTKSSTLSSFIQYAAKSYPANRNILILWDHGGGSVTGYGYDERFSSSSAMNLQGIREALENGGVKFDFIGFDACLMATTETALTLEPYADYLIASEETEPGIGWHYTRWVSSLSENTSISTLELGKQIVDDFISNCAYQCSGQKATLSVTDLAELAAVIPDALKDFSESTTALIKADGYSQVSNARSGAREFATSSKIDQIDVVSFARNLGTEEAEELADAILSAVKYNKTSANMTNAYGLSIFFPYKNSSYVKSAVQMYKDIGFETAYSDCVRAFTGMQSAGQSTSYVSSGYSSVSGAGYSTPAYSYDVSSISSLLNSLLSGSGYYSDFGREIPQDRAAAFISEHYFDAEKLKWQRTPDGGKGIYLDAEDWDVISDLELSLYYDDGTGYIDLGLDNIYSFSEDGALLGEFDGTWLAINDQPVAYYHLDTLDDGVNYTITGRVPVLYNGDRADLILVFDNENPYGTVAGLSFDYVGGETDTVPKLFTELQPGDTIDFLCDYYDYQGNYSDSYMLGDRLVYDGTLEISNVYLPDASAAYPMYCFTDIYYNQYWSPAF